MMRSRFIDEDAIKDFTSVETGLPNSSGCSEYWFNLMQVEDELFSWWRDRMEITCQGIGMYEELRKQLLHAFMAGLWFGERRWAAKSGDVFNFGEQ